MKNYLSTFMSFMMRKMSLLMFLIFACVEIGKTTKLGISGNYFCHFDCGRVHTCCERAPCFLSKERCGRDGRSIPLRERERKLVLEKLNILRNRFAIGDGHLRDKTVADMVSN